MDDHRAANRETWEALAEHHPGTEFYDVEAFLDGESTLDPVEPEELGPVEGGSLLHLQCHFGLDTLSWARRGAEVTGVDFAGTAVETARDLASEAGLADRATFSGRTCTTCPTGWSDSLTSSTPPSACSRGWRTWIAGPR